MTATRRSGDQFVTVVRLETVTWRISLLPWQDEKEVTRGNSGIACYHGKMIKTDIGDQHVTIVTLGRRILVISLSPFSEA